MAAAWRITVGTTPVDLFETVPAALLDHGAVGLLWRVVTDGGEVVVGGSTVSTAEGYPWADTDGSFPITTKNHPWVRTAAGTVEVAVFVDADY